MIVGVLASQGGFAEVLASASRCGVAAVEVRTRAELERVHALIVPGGESTTINSLGMQDGIKAFKGPIWGVCAGLIILSQLKLLPVSVDRNAFGRQSASCWRKLELSGSARHLSDRQIFIRAPAVSHAGPAHVLAKTKEGVIVAVQHERFLGTAFHPELSGHDDWMHFFLTTICGANVANPAALGDVSLVAPWTARADEAVKRSFAVFQKGGVIMDVVNAEQARLAEAAGAVAVMALERIPADIKADGGIARTSDPHMIKEILAAVSIPVMAKARIGHFAEAQMLEALDVDCIDESEVLTAADETHHIDKRPFRIPFVCGAKNLGEALRRIAEGAAMIRVKGNAGTGNVMHAVRHARTIQAEIRGLQSLRDDEVFNRAKELQVPLDLLFQTRACGRLPVVLFAAGGLATPADVALLMQLGVDGVFVGSGIFKGDNPAQRAKAMVMACTHFRDARVIARVSERLGKAMVGILDQGESYVLTNHDSKL